jgi:hypothetical protein
MHVVMTCHMRSALLFVQVRHHLPTGSNEWKHVTDDYNTDRDHAGGSDQADVDRVKNKFTSLYNRKKPTGNHVKSRFIQEAQDIQSLIESKLHGCVESPHVIKDDDDDGLSENVPESQCADDEEKGCDVIRPGVRGRVSLDEITTTSSSSSSSNDSRQSSSKKRKYRGDSDQYDLKDATASITETLSVMMTQQLDVIKQERQIRSQELTSVTDAFKSSFVAAIEAILSKK